MQRGHRDDHIRIRVPQESCFRYKSKTTGTWTEVKIPGGNDTQWDSFMVDPKQLFYDAHNDKEFNIIEGVNRNTMIKVSTKRLEADGSRTIIKETTFDPVEILKMFAFCNANSEDLI